MPSSDYLIKMVFGSQNDKQVYHRSAPIRVANLTASCLHPRQWKHVDTSKM